MDALWHWARLTGRGFGLQRMLGAATKRGALALSGTGPEADFGRGGGVGGKPGSTSAAHRAGDTASRLSRKLSRAREAGRFRERAEGSAPHLAAWRCRWLCSAAGGTSRTGDDPTGSSVDGVLPPPPRARSASRASRAACARRAAFPAQSSPPGSVRSCRRIMWSMGVPPPSCSSWRAYALRATQLSTSAMASLGTGVRNPSSIHTPPARATSDSTWNWRWMRRCIDFSARTARLGSEAAAAPRRRTSRSARMLCTSAAFSSSAGLIRALRSAPGRGADRRRVGFSHRKARALTKVGWPSQPPRDECRERCRWATASGGLPVEGLRSRLGRAVPHALPAGDRVHRPYHLHLAREEHVEVTRLVALLHQNLAALGSAARHAGGHQRERVVPKVAQHGDPAHQPHAPQLRAVALDHRGGEKKARGGGGSGGPGGAGHHARGAPQAVRQVADAVARHERQHGRHHRRGRRVLQLDRAACLPGGADLAGVRPGVRPLLEYKVRVAAELQQQAAANLVLLHHVLARGAAAPPRRSRQHRHVVGVHVEARTKVAQTQHDGGEFGLGAVVGRLASENFQLRQPLQRDGLAAAAPAGVLGQREPRGELCLARRGRRLEPGAKDPAEVAPPVLEHGVVMQNVARPAHAGKPRRHRRADLRPLLTCHRRHRRGETARHAQRSYPRNHNKMAMIFFQHGSRHFALQKSKFTVLKCKQHDKGYQLPSLHAKAPIAKTNYK
eukprot:scaffold606_cov115-Isochrysis_galbana.AAC.2